MGAKGLALTTSDGVNAQLAKLEQSIQLASAKCGFFAAALDFDELAAAGHYQVHVDLRVFIFCIIEIEQLLVIEQADADGGHTNADD